MPAAAFSTMASAQAQSCGGTFNQSDGAVGQSSAGAATSSSGQCGDGSSSSATASATASIPAARITVDGNGTGFQEFNGAFAQASFSERLTVENVPAALASVDVRVTIAFVGIPPAPAFYNSASMDGYVNPQGIPGQVRLHGCSGDLCVGSPGPVRTETLQQTVTLPRNGLGTFGFIDVFLDARFAIAQTDSFISGTVSVELPDVPGAILVSESGVFASEPDSDGDEVPDQSDNCTLAPNPAQRDTDGDGFGNRCDADLNNDCVVNAADLGVLKSVFFSSDADADFNGDGVVNTADLGLLKAGFFGPPGPSAVAILCTG
jgi:hypothetical protein